VHLFDEWLCLKIKYQVHPSSAKSTGWSEFPHLKWPFWGDPGYLVFRPKWSKHGPLGHRSSFQKALERWPLFCQWLPPIYLFGSPKSKHFNDCIDLQKKKLRAPFRSKCSFKRIMGSIDRSSIESREQKDAHIKLGATMHRDKMPNQTGDNARRQARRRTGQFWPPWLYKKKEYFQIKPLPAVSKKTGRW